MKKAIQIFVAVVLTLFLVGLGAFGGCLAGAMTTKTSNHPNNDFMIFGFFGGGLAGLWIGILLARQLVDRSKPRKRSPPVDSSKIHHS